MAQAVHETTYDVDAAQLYAAVTDYEKYPEFVDGMKKVTVDRSGGQVVGNYELSMMGKDMSYSLNLIEEPEKGHVSWTLRKSEFFKVNNGDWLIQSNGPGKCKARYFSEVEFTFPVPAFVLKPMVKGAIPKMMDGFYLRAKKLPTPVVYPKAESSKVEEPKIETAKSTAPSIEPVPHETEALKVAEVQADAPVTPKQEKESAPKNSFFAEDLTNRKNSSMNEQHDSGVLSWAKKIMTVGVGTFFLTEESLRSMVSEFKLPKELMGQLLDGAKGVRKEFMQNVVSEMMTKLNDKMNPSELLAEFLKKNEVTFEIKVKVKEKTDTNS